MKWILMFCLACGCAESLSVDAYDLPDGGDVPSDGDTDTDAEAMETDSEWMFDCDRACDFEATCGMYSSTYAGWDACHDGCEADLDTDMTEEQKAAAECVWFECVLEGEAGELACVNWVDCINDCTNPLFD